MQDINELENRLLLNTIDYFDGDVRRINHLIKVYTFAKTIGAGENLADKEYTPLVLAAIVHDCGIKVSEAKYNSAAGKYQEIEGPTVAKALAEPLGLDRETVDRILFLVGHHHTYNMVDGADYQILIEADFLVNAYEDNLDLSAIKAAERNFFKTRTGKELLAKLYYSKQEEL